MEPIHLAFLWHQHQPFYKDLSQGRYVLPWVRLHAIKDYIGLALVLKEFPGIRCTINMAPSLVVQIQDYAEGKAEDDALRITRKPAAELDEDDCAYLVEHFFTANPDRLIRPVPRYNELYEKRGASARQDRRCATLFDETERRDLQVWASLAWFHPLVVQGDEALRGLIEKGRNFSEDDKAVMLKRQDAVIRRIIPLHREMIASGQIEVSTTPFYHPILPLLVNMECAREALPHVPMPETRSDFAADAAVHVDRALALHKEVFGRPATGIWPAEGSVSTGILPLLADRGLVWIATDEGVLARSASVDLGRDNAGVLNKPAGLYQPFALPGGEGMPAVVFRDRVLSDAIGFEYHHGDPVRGAENFVGRLEETAKRCATRPLLAPVILDGENPWDYYDTAGLTFLRALYDRLARSDAVATTTLSEYVGKHPPTQSLRRLHAGSWINADFHIWIGDAEDRTAWSALAQAREAVIRRASGENAVAPDAAREAWEHIYIAEGSDWCWWFGNDHTSAQDYMFDALFRAHLKGAYRLIGERPPETLDHPIGKPEPSSEGRRPRRRLDVTTDGRKTNASEWAWAGRYAAVSATMDRTVAGPVKAVMYGFGRDVFLLRLDAAGRFVDKVKEDTRIIVRLTRPNPALLHAERLDTDDPLLRVLDGRGKLVDELRSLAVRDFFELVCPLGLLAAQGADAIEFHIEVIEDGGCIQRVPPEGDILLAQPEDE